MEVIVREAVPADAAAIARVHVRSWQEGYRGLVPDAILTAMSVPGRQARWHEILGRDAESSSCTLVAQSGVEVVGFCSTIAPSRDEDAAASTAEIGAIYVEPGRWRSGAGSALLETALRRLREDGRRDVTLWVFDRNVRARTFYARFGFMPDGCEMRDERTGLPEVRLRLIGAGAP